MYYLRTRAAADAIKFTVDTRLLKENGNRVGVLVLIPYVFFFFFKMIHHGHLHMQVNSTKPTEDVEAKMAQMVCSLNNREECLACGS
jgi:ribonucleoside-diphosphate reductase subunit M1